MEISRRTEDRKLLTGNGEWTYRVVEGWGRLPAGTNFGGTHGGIAIDSIGDLYVSTQSETGILVYSPDGILRRTIAHDYPEIHSIFYERENSSDFLYVTVQQGRPEENWLFMKMKTDGTVVKKIIAPPEAGFKAGNEWRLTSAVRAPDDSIVIANGYGDCRLLRFDKDGDFREASGARGSGNGFFDCNHGLAVDRRYDQPLLLVCDRENRRLCHLDFDGCFVDTIAHHLRRPCQVSFYGDYAVVSELEGRITILDRDNVPVAFLGDNPQKQQWANYEIQPFEIASNLFSAPHGIRCDMKGNIYVSDWNRSGRVTKLERFAG